MKNRQDPLQHLDDKLKNLPKPNLTKTQKQTIQNAIQQPNQRRKWKKFPSLIGAMAAFFLFSILIVTSLQEEEQTADEQPLINIMSEEIESVIAYELSGNEVKYVFTEQEIINSLQDTFRQLDLTKTEKESILYDVSFELYNKDETLITTFELSSWDKELIRIDGVNYTINDIESLQNFILKHFTTEYKDQESKESEEILQLTKELKEEIEKLSWERDWDKIIQLVENGADPNNNYAIHAAVEDNHLEATETMITHGANPNQVGRFGRTPLMVTTDFLVAELLLQHGADPNITTSSGHDALLFAIQNHQPDMVELLLTAGANPNTSYISDTEKEITAIWLAQMYGDDKSINLLLEHGAEETDKTILNEMTSEIPNLSEMLNENILEQANKGRLPGLSTIQVPSDSRDFPEKYGEPFSSAYDRGGIRDVYGDHMFNRGDGGDLYKRYQFYLSPDDEVTIGEVVDKIGNPTSAFSSGNTSDRHILVYELEDYSLHFIFNGEVVIANESGEIESYSDDGKVVSVELIYNHLGIVYYSDIIFQLLQEEDMETLQKYVHPEKGLTFAPFLQLDQDRINEQLQSIEEITGVEPPKNEFTPVQFSMEEIPYLLEDENHYFWGIYPESGTGFIEMTPAEYMDSFIFTAQDPDHYTVNSYASRGEDFLDTVVRDVYPIAAFVNYGFDETEESNAFFSGGNNLFVFERYNGKDKLVAILHDAWTP